MRIQPILPSDRAWAEKLVASYFGSAKVVSRGLLHDTRLLPGLVAVRGKERVGLLLYRIVQGQCEVVVLISALPRQGIGRALLEAVQPIAADAGCTRLWLITTNNNHDAQAFYQAVGWRQSAIHYGAVREARILKPEIPEFDENGEPITDEIEFEY
jgi:ribosomal protein S18 acetylase RimI-like enzyme